jgi:hypothetical protein
MVGSWLELDYFPVVGWPNCAGMFGLALVLVIGLVISCEILCNFGPFLSYFYLYLQNKSIHQNYGIC